MTICVPTLDGHLSTVEVSDRVAERYHQQCAARREAGSLYCMKYPTAGPDVVAALREKDMVVELTW